VDTYRLYEAAMQVVPLLLIALFLDNRRRFDAAATTRRGRAWQRFQERVVAGLSVVAFFVAMFVLAGVVPQGALTDGVVIAALAGALGLLVGMIWTRFAGDDRDAAPSPGPE
jgi:hypothetical protein